MRRTVLLIILLGLACFGPPSTVMRGDEPDLVVLWYPPSLYVRVKDFSPARDKVWRLLAGDDVLDFLGERTIPSATSEEQTGSAFFKSSTVLRYGGEESPVVLIDGAFAGGHHKPVTSYKRTILLDGAPVGATGLYHGYQLSIAETYRVPDAGIEISHMFSAGDFAHFRYAITPERPMKVVLTGMQAQKVSVQDGQTLRLIVAGVIDTDLTLNREMFILPPSWAATGKPPERFDAIVSRQDAPLFGFAMGYDPGQEHGDLSNALYISKFGKLYPRGFESSERFPMVPGVTRTITGYFGSYDLSSGKGT